MKFEFWEMASGRPAIIAQLDKGNEAVLLQSADEAAIIWFIKNVWKKINADNNE